MTDALLLRDVRALGLEGASVRALVLYPFLEPLWELADARHAVAENVLRLAIERLELEPEAQAVVRGWLADPPVPSWRAAARSVVSSLARRQRGRWSPPTDPSEGAELARALSRALAGIHHRRTPPPERNVFDAIAALVPREAAWWAEVAVDAADVPTQGQSADEWEVATDVRPSPLPPAPPPVEVPDEGELPETARRATLVRLDGRLSATLGPGGEITVGRNRENTVQVLDDGEISRRHCRLFQRGAGWYVEDLGSMNGTYVDGDRVSLRQLRGGEELTIGHAIYRFVVEADTLTPFDDLLRD